MKNYNQYTVEDFVQDSYFRESILDNTPEAAHFWATFCAENPTQKDTIEVAKSMVLGLKIKDIPTDNALIQEQIQRILTLTEDEVETPVIPFYNHTWFRMAASIALLFAAGLWFFNKNTEKSTPSVSEANLAQIIDIQKVRTDTLIRFSDGSTAQLKRGGSMQFAKNFVGKQRVVTLLSGEAFFDVIKNPERPFIVMANDIVTKVLGTSFTVRTSNTEGGTSSVVVRTGRVAVFKKSDFSELETADKDVVFLTPNQQVNQKETTSPLVVSIAEKPVLIEKPVDNPDFAFENVPISTVLNTLEKAYNIQIVADEAILKSCRMTISLGSKDALFEKLTVVCKVIGAKYQVSDTRIIVSGKGC